MSKMTKLQLRRHRRLHFQDKLKMMTTLMIGQPSRHFWRQVINASGLLPLALQKTTFVSTQILLGQLVRFATGSTKCMRTVDIMTTRGIRVSTFTASRQSQVKRKRTEQSTSQTMRPCATLGLPYSVHKGLMTAWINTKSWGMKEFQLLCSSRMQRQDILSGTNSPASYI